MVIILRASLELRTYIILYIDTFRILKSPLNQHYNIIIDIDNTPIQDYIPLVNYLVKKYKCFLKRLKKKKKTNK